MKCNKDKYKSVADAKEAYYKYFEYCKNKRLPLITFEGWLFKQISETECEDNG